jgi:tetratricopeptide (TPR) repeat protein
MEKGLRNNPDDYWLAFEMGLLHYLEGRDYREAEKYFRVAATLPNSDGNRAARFAAEAASKGGNIEASIALWKEMAENSDNRYIRELAERYIAKLEARRQQQTGGGI